MFETKTHGQPAQFKVDFSARTITGYCSVFGNLDEVGDVVVAGAFKKTIADRLPRRLIKFLYNHFLLVGSVVEASEDSYGLLTVNKVSEVPEGQKVLQLTAEEHLTHMSFGYDVKRREIVEPESPGASYLRRLLELKWYEASAVDFPANELASILSVKELSEQLRQAADAVPQLSAMLAKKGFFKDSEIDLYKHLSGVVSKAIADSVKALSEGQPELVDADAATTPPNEPPPTTGEIVTDPETTVYADIEAHLAALRMELSLANTRAAAH